MRLMLLDASGFIHRAFHAHAKANLTRPSDGHPVGALHGFCTMLMGTLRDRGFTHAAAIFDHGRKSWRHRLFEGYKADRATKPSNPDLVRQMGPCRDAARAFGMLALEREGYEADDLIATYTRLGIEAGIDVVIVTSDKDMMQLVGPGVQILDTMSQAKRGGRTLIGPQEVQAAMGVPPRLVADLLALMGDAIDNVPGVPGIGPKIAAELLMEHGCLEAVLAAAIAGSIKQPKRRAALVERANQALLSRRLVELADEIPVMEQIEDLRFEIDLQRLDAFAASWEFVALRAQIRDVAYGTGRPLE